MGQLFIPLFIFGIFFIQLNGFNKRIKSKIILNKKDIRLDKFLSISLFSKTGYYKNKIPIGKKNDFVTAPEVSQMFGEIIGLYLLYIWSTKINSKYNLIELGPEKELCLKIFSEVFQNIQISSKVQKYNSLKLIKS